MRDMSASATLPWLLWAVLGGLVRAYVEEGADGIHMPSLDLWANFLRVLDREGVDCKELPALLRLSKRAVRTRITTAARRGWAEERKSGRGHAAVLLTARAATVAARWKSLQDDGEERWRAQAGADRARTLRVCLEDLVARLPSEHPHYPAGYGPADATITGGNGQDWKAVPRSDGDTVTGLPLSALVSQALVAFAMRYEDRALVALSLSMNVIQRIPSEGRAVRELGDSVGVSALARHGFLRVSGAGGSETVSLTAKGTAVKNAYEERVEAVEGEWRRHFGEARITALRRALEDVAGMARQRGVNFS